MLSDHQWAFMKDLAHLITFIATHKPEMKVTGGELYRTHEQAELYAQRGIGIVDSLHRSRLAIDLNLFIDGVYQTSSEAYRPLGDYWEALSTQNRWGGNFSRPDGNHFQRTV